MLRLHSSELTYFSVQNFRNNLVTAIYFVAILLCHSKIMVFHIHRRYALKNFHHFHIEKNTVWKRCGVVVSFFFVKRNSFHSCNKNKTNNKNSNNKSVIALYTMAKRDNDRTNFNMETWFCLLPLLYNMAWKFTELFMSNI